MSNYIGKATNPDTGFDEPAEFLDDYFGKHVYGVRFAGSKKVYRESELEPEPFDAGEPLE